MKRLIIFIQMLLVVLSLSAFTLAADSSEGIKTKGLVINPNPQFNASIWTDRNEYKVGDPVRIYFKSDEDGYAIIYDYTSDGGSQVVWPRNGQPQKIRGGSVYSIPDGNYSLTASEPTGPERLILVIARNRDSLVFESHRGNPFWEGLKLRLFGVSDSLWTSASCDFTVNPKYQPVLRISGEASRVFLDGNDMGTMPGAVLLSPGHHQVVAVKPGMGVIVRDIWANDMTNEYSLYLDFEPLR